MSIKVIFNGILNVLTSNYVFQFNSRSIIQFTLKVFIHKLIPLFFEFPD